MKIEKILTKGLARLPELILRPLLKRKIEEVGIDITDEAIDAMVIHIMSGNNEPFVWSDKSDSEEKTYINTKLEITDNDISEIDTSLSKAMDIIPDLVDRIIEDTGYRVFNRMRNKWSAEDAAIQMDVDNFRSNMEDRWGVGLGYLRMLLTCCRELGDETLKRYNKTKSKRHRFRRWVLTRLHARSCQITDEIICLLENGFANGAMARWRTLHEISVIAMLIRDGNEDLAERYIAHNAIELKRHLDDYEINQTANGFKKINDKERLLIESQYNDALSKYGSSFAGQYGWASNYLSLKKPTFKDLQIKSEQSAKNTYYKLASFDVHATSRSLFFNLNVISDELLLSGRSNAGLLDPGINTAESLLIVTHSLFGNSTNLDRLVEINCLLRIREAIITEFSRADRKLRRDERIYRNGNKRISARKY